MSDSSSSSDLCPLQQGVVRYAREHEAELREKAIDAATLFLANCSFEDLLGKFTAGCKEHGPINPLHDFQMEAENESRDLFWYMAMIDFLLERGR